MLNHHTDARPASIDLPSWGAQVGPGCILGFTYPSHGRRRPDPEPHLVVELILYGGEPALVLAPGVPAVGQPVKGTGLYCTEDDLAAVRGLHAPTVFMTDRRSIVLFTHRGLVEAMIDGSPVLGALLGPALGRLRRLRGQLHVERMLAEHRRRQRYLVGRDAVRDVDFEVVARRPTRGGDHPVAVDAAGRGEGRA